MLEPSVKLTVGRIVHFVPQANSIEAHNYVKEVPAIITNVFGNGALVNLKVFTDGIYDTWKTSVKYSETNEENSWHWPVKQG